MRTIHEIEKEAKAAGIYVAELCRTAGIAHTTFVRQRKGKTDGKISTLQKLEAALKKLKRRKNGKS